MMLSFVRGKDSDEVGTIRARHQQTDRTILAIQRLNAKSFGERAAGVVLALKVP